MTGGDRTEREWVVLLEAAKERGSSTIDPVSFGRMVSSWATPVPTSLHSRDRYALQIPVTAAHPASALSLAMSLWKDAVCRSGLAMWGLVRAEILTPEELEREQEAAEQAGGGTAGGPQSPPADGEDVGEADLLRMALHDAVTGLPGREVFIDEVRRALATGPPGSRRHAVLVVHLEGPDIGGSAPGRPVPDDLLADVAGRLKGVVRRADTVACVGPAEFALLVEAPSTEDPHSLARRIGDHVGASLLQRSHPRPFTASVGVVATTPGADADEVMRRAEMAVLAARSPDGGRHTHTKRAAN